MRGRKRLGLNFWGVMLALLLPASGLWAGNSINLTATLTTDCPDCATDAGFFSNTSGTSGVYSQLPDVLGAYAPSSTLESQILTHNSVYTLDTMNTLGTSTPRTVNMHFYSPVEGIAPNDNLPFNVCNGVCDTQVYRFYLKWSAVTIVRMSTNTNTWVVTSSGPCNDLDGDNDTDNCGTASLYGQGGEHGQTIYYGDWRVPFQITLTQ